MSKVCKDCRIEKPLEEFYSAIQRGKRVYRGDCKRCVLDAQKIYRSTPEGRELQNKRSKRWYQRNIPKVMISNARLRARKEGLDFNIDLSDIHIPEYCPVLGVKLVPGVGQPSNDAPTLDRINNHKGYVKGNVWVISRRANTIKNDASLDELRSLVKALENITLEAGNE